MDLLDRRAVRRLLPEAGGEDRFPREGLEFVLSPDHWPRTHRPALLLQRRPAPPPGPEAVTPPPASPKL
ncbi:hypothetical protein ACFUN8_08135 [Streptomyces sp. NPDC057307]|uniref:hypothetical protein n=1 Tax=Streptomyces sp. NPDC057307 TaxID=3346096 RepID=UPI00363091B3